jgi:hypothetical protein
MAWADLKITPTPASSNIAGYHYDAAGARLTVEFKDGKRYRYADVPEEVASEMIEAESIGKYFNEHIRNAFGGIRLMTDAEKEAMIADGADPASLEDK